MRPSLLDRMSADFEAAVLTLVPAVTAAGYAHLSDRLFDAVTRMGLCVRRSYRSTARAVSRKHPSPLLTEAADTADEIVYLLELIGRTRILPAEGCRPLIKKAEALSLALFLASLGLSPTADYYPFDTDQGVEVPLENVLSITPEALIYRTPDGDTIRIDLAACADRYERENGIPPHDTPVRCVGDRCAGENGYYELFTEPRVYLVQKDRLSPAARFLKRLGFHVTGKQFAAFYAVQKRLNENGWSTLDLN